MPLPQSMLTSEPADLDLELLSGEIPPGLVGEVFVSAPDPRTPGDYRLFGEGLVFRLALQPGVHGAGADRYPWRVQRLDTPSVRLREKVPGAFAVGPMGLTSSFGAPNLANTAPLPWGDRMFVTWDVGRPLEIDPESLAFLGEVGHREQWGSFMPGVLPFVFSTAHPVIDPERGCMWTVKLDPVAMAPHMTMQPSVVRWDGEGASLKTWPVENARVPGMMHTISQTREWLLLAESGMFRADPGEIAGGERTVTNDAVCPVYLIRKEELEATREGEAVRAHEFTVAPETGHYYARYDDAEGIEVVFEHQECFDLGLKLRPEDRDLFGEPVTHPGMYGMGMAPAQVSIVRFDPRSGKQTDRARLRDPERFWNLQLSAMDWSLEGQCSPTLHHVVMHGYRPNSISQRALALYEDRVDRSLLADQETPARLVSIERDGLEVAGEHVYAPDDLPTSPAFVPRDPGSTTTSRYAGSDPGGHDGWLVVPVLSDTGFRVDLFDAGDVGAGPVASLGSGGETVPLLLHSAWAPQVLPAPAAERLRFSDEIGGDVLASLPDDLRAAAREVAAELDAG